MKFLNLLVVILPGVMLALSGHSFADTVYIVDCKNSSINGRIKYSVIGQYRSNFKECSGRIIYDKDQRQIKSVVLEIRSKSIHSNCRWCDDIVRSKQLLDTEQHPLITFKADVIENKNDAYVASGDLNLHGITRELNANFVIEDRSDDVLEARGQWILRRKDFGITWNRLLDHGGVLVGDHITVDWHIKAESLREQ